MPPPSQRFSLYARLLIAAAGVCLLQPIAHSQDRFPDGTGGGKETLAANAPGRPRTDKSQYSLFHPTPRDLLRPFNSSRPDQTTGAHSVDAGHYYLETGVAYSLDLGITRTDTWDYFQSTHLRVGLLDNVELELVWGGLDNTRTRTRQSSSHARTDSTIDGSTDLTVRTRLVLVGNESKKFSFSLNPEVIVPVTSHHVDSEYVQGDVIIATSFELPAGFSTTINVQPGIFRNANDTDYEFALVSGITLYHDLLRKKDRVQGYLEYYDTLVTGPGSTDAQQVDVGVRWRPLENLQFDAGCNFGVSVDAADYQPFVGLVTRF